MGTGCQLRKFQDLDFDLENYRVDQIRNAYFSGRYDGWEEVTVLPAKLRDYLKKNIPFLTLRLVKLEENLNSRKALFETLDGNYIETVLMSYDDGRNSICLSSMSGCPVGCKFCATGQMGFVKNLSVDEIVDQLLFFKRLLFKEGKHLTNVDFMGMGEPLLNFESVIEAFQLFNDKQKIGLSRRKIIISTSGYVPQIKRLADLNLGNRLAISLHSAKQEVRESIMPVVAKLFSIKELMKAVDYYITKTRKRVTFEYLLLSGVNDSIEDARALAKLVSGRLVHVNLIQFNSVVGINYQRSSLKQVRLFESVLRKNRIPVTVRVSLGEDIKAACGQLVYNKKEVNF